MVRVIFEFATELHISNIKNAFFHWTSLLKDIVSLYLPCQILIYNLTTLDQIALINSMQTIFLHANLICLVPVSFGELDLHFTKANISFLKCLSTN